MVARPGREVSSEGVETESGLVAMLNDSRLVAECFDTQKRPGGHVLCAMTFAQVEKSALDAVKVGARCQLESSKPGI